MRQTLFSSARWKSARKCPAPGRHWPATGQMSSSDSAWLQGALDIAASGLGSLEEAEMRYAIGKYFDDISDFEQAFRHYRRANSLMKSLADPYDRDARARFVDDLIRIYTSDAIASRNEGISASSKPIFVVGMPRSGTSLAEQIIASHPAVKGAGELGFCNDAMLEPDSELRRGVLSDAARKGWPKATCAASRCTAAKRSASLTRHRSTPDYLGPIHSVFRMPASSTCAEIPIDSCLSSYFQHFSAAMNFTLDLQDLAHCFGNTSA